MCGKKKVKFMSENQKTIEFTITTSRDQLVDKTIEEIKKHTYLDLPISEQKHFRGDWAVIRNLHDVAISVLMLFWNLFNRRSNRNLPPKIIIPVIEMQIYLNFS